MASRELSRISGKFPVTLDWRVETTFLEKCHARFFVCMYADRHVRSASSGFPRIRPCKAFRGHGRKPLMQPVGAEMVRSALEKCALGSTSHTVLASCEAATDADIFLASSRFTRRRATGVRRWGWSGCCGCSFYRPGSTCRTRLWKRRCMSR
jgi:hypothetical protein